MGKIIMESITLTLHLLTAGEKKIVGEKERKKKKEKETRKEGSVCAP